MHDTSRLSLERREIIATRLARGVAVTANELAAEFGLSVDAIRRDLPALASDGLCRRVYGGAMPMTPSLGPMHLRIDEGSPAKAALARKALDLIQPGQVVFIDTGSTTAELAACLPQDRALTVLTNSMPAAAALQKRPDLSLLIIGGQYDPFVGGCIGSRAIAEVARHRIDLCFLGACALSLEHGLCGVSLEDVDFKTALLAASRTSAVMMTNDKLGTIAPHSIAAAGRIGTFVLEHDAPALFAAGLRAAGADVLQATRPDLPSVDN